MIGFSQVKTWLIAALSIALGIVAAWLGIQKAKTETIRRKTEEAARKSQEKATEAMVEGLEKESKVNENEDINRNHFE